MSRLLAQGASVLNFQSDGNSNKRLRDILGILKKFKDADPADSKWKSRVEGLSRLAALAVHRERLPAGALQRGLARDPESVVLVPNPVVFAPWLVLLEASLVTAVKTHQTTLFL